MEGFIGIAVAGITALLGAYMIVTGDCRLLHGYHYATTPESERPRLARETGAWMVVLAVAITLMIPSALPDWATVVGVVLLVAGIAGTLVTIARHNGGLVTSASGSGLGGLSPRAAMAVCVAVGALLRGREPAARLPLRQRGAGGCSGARDRRGPGHGGPWGVGSDLHDRDRRAECAPTCLALGQGAHGRGRRALCREPRGHAAAHRPLQRLAHGSVARRDRPREPCGWAVPSPTPSGLPVTAMRLTSLGARYLSTDAAM